MYIVCSIMQDYVHIPVFQCGECQISYNEHPIRLGFYPAQVDMGVDLWKNRGRNFIPVWFEFRVLDRCLVGMRKTPELTPQAHLASVFEHGDGFATGMRCKKPPLHMDELRRHFNHTVRYYGRLDYELRDFSYVLAINGYATGVFGACPPCGFCEVRDGRVHDASTDGIYKVTHQRSAGRATTCRPGVIHRKAWGDGITAGEFFARSQGMPIFPSC